MFNKKLYRKNREAKKRGQGELPRSAVKPKEPGDKHFASGEQVVRGPKGLMMISRKQKRLRAPNRSGSKPIKPRSSADRRKDSLISKGKLDPTERPAAEFRHVVSEPGHSTNDRKRPKPWPYPAEMTNHERHEWRRERRQKLREAADGRQ